MVIQTENAKSQWKEFWEFIGAKGDFAKSAAEWNIPRNTREDRGEVRK
jgi:hypothetical protein